MAGGVMAPLLMHDAVLLLPSCPVNNVMLNFCMSVTAFNACAVIFDRTLCIVYPYRYHRLLRPKSVAVFLIALWVMSALVAPVDVLFSEEETTYLICDGPLTLHYIPAIAIFLLPLGVMLILNLHILLFYCKQRRTDARRLPLGRRLSNNKSLSTRIEEWYKYMKIEMNPRPRPPSQTHEPKNDKHVRIGSAPLKSQYLDWAINVLGCSVDTGASIINQADLDKLKEVLAQQGVDLSEHYSRPPSIMSAPTRSSGISSHHKNLTENIGVPTHLKPPTSRLALPTLPTNPITPRSSALSFLSWRSTKPDHLEFQKINKSDTDSDAPRSRRSQRSILKKASYRSWETEELFGSTFNRRQAPPIQPLSQLTVDIDENEDEIIFEPNTIYFCSECWHTMRVVLVLFTPLLMLGCCRAALAADSVGWEFTSARMSLWLAFLTTLFDPILYFLGNKIFFAVIKQYFLSFWCMRICKNKQGNPTKDRRSSIEVRANILTSPPPTYIEAIRAKQHKHLTARKKKITSKRGSVVTVGSGPLPRRGSSLMIKRQLLGRRGSQKSSRRGSEATRSVATVSQELFNQEELVIKQEHVRSLVQQAQEQLDCSVTRPKK